MVTFRLTRQSQPFTPNPSRRTTEPGWAAVQNVASSFGPVMFEGRDHNVGQRRDFRSFTQHMAGYLPGYAARLGCDDLDEALAMLTRDRRKYWRTRNFREACRTKRAELGLPPVASPAA